MSNINHVVGMSAELREALSIFATQQNVSMSDCMRTAIAQYIGYDLAAEKADKVERRGRPRKYATDEERKQVMYAKAKKVRANTRELVAQFRQQESRLDMAKFRKAYEDKHGPIDAD